MRYAIDSIEILGVEVARATVGDALSAVEAVAETGPALVAYANAHTLNLAHADPGYRDLLRRCDLVLNDGAGLAIAARIKGKPFPANLNGSDLNPLILELAARRGWKVFFVGAGAGVAETAARNLGQRIPELEIVGTRDGFFDRSEDAAAAAQVRSAGADVVLVAMGNPLQEKWLEAHLEATGCRLGVGVGAFFDFSAERVRRAPAWMNKLGIEWVFRLLLEPRRMWRRYVVGNPAFLWRVLKEYRSARRAEDA